MFISLLYVADAFGKIDKTFLFLCDLDHFFYSSSKNSSAAYIRYKLK